MFPALAIAFIGGCVTAPSPLAARIDARSDGVGVAATRPIDRVQVYRHGRPVVDRVLRTPMEQVSVRMPVHPGVYEVTVHAGLERAVEQIRVADDGPLVVEVRAPIGQAPLEAGATVLLPDGDPVAAGIVVSTSTGGEVEWSFPGAVGRKVLARGESMVVPAIVGRDGLVGQVRLGEAVEAVDIRAQSVPLGVLADQLELTRVVVPAMANGTRDVTLPAGRVELAAAWWDALLDTLRIGFRARDDLAPRTHLGMTLVNRGDEDLNVLIRARFPDAALRPRLRDAVSLDRVDRWLRVPAGRSVVAALPVYVDGARIDRTTTFPIELSVVTLGSERALHRREVPLVVRRGNGWATCGMVAALLLALAGWGLTARRLSGWLQRPTAELTTIASFGALLFTVGLASQLVGLGVATVLGPFSPFVLGLVDDVLRMTLLGTLLLRVPRVGTATLAILTGWIIRAIAVGAVHPVDLVSIGAAIALHEGMLWATGVTRGNGSAWALALGLAVPHAIGVGISLAISSIVYRLFFADVYVIALILVPGGLYAAIGALFAVPFAARLSVST